MKPLRLAFAFVFSLCLALSTASVAAADHTVWFNPTAARLSGFGAFVAAAVPQAIRVQHSGGPAPQSGTLTIALSVRSDVTIDSLIVCYRTAPQDFPSKLTGITLRTMTLPTATTTLYTDTTQRLNVTGECAAINVTDVVPAGAPEIVIAYTVEPLTFIEIGAIGVVVKSSTLVGVNDATDAAAPSVAMASSRPNPFAASTRIDYSVSAPGRVHLQIFDTSGRAVRTLRDEPLAAGEHSEWWDGRDESGREVGAGVYLARLSAPSGEQASQRITIVR